MREELPVNRKNISIIIPACNEENGLTLILPRLMELYGDTEIIVVNDCSTDNTKAICMQYNVKVIDSPYKMGNGAAVKAGVREATGDSLVFMDADGQHQPDDIKILLEKMDEGFDMVVGARERGSHHNVYRLFANSFYNFLASWITSHTILDLTSGFRVVNAIKFKEFLHLLPNGFSYPTTITMAFFRAAFSICYVKVNVKERIGSSHIRPFRDGIRFLLIIFKIGTLYSPLKFFAPISLIIFMTGLSYYVYTFINQRQFTNMSALLFTTSILVFFIGIVSEQLTMLSYKDKQ
jgi:glycosyltransferase involved in cell wall biosynthesis